MMKTILGTLLVGLLGAACGKERREPEGTRMPTAEAGQAGKPAAAAPALAPGATMPAGHPPIDGTGAGGPVAGGQVAGGLDPGGGGQKLQPAGAGRLGLGPFTLAAPASWEERPTRSSMLAAEWRLPGEGGKDASLVVYFFGAGGAGGVEANLDRWIGQFKQADGAPARPQAKVTTTTLAGQKATRVAVEGRYVAAVTPGSAEMRDEPEWQMLAAIVESPAGPYYFKLVGPRATVAAQAAAFDELLASLAIAPAR
jgi:hypothetical protein